MTNEIKLPAKLFSWDDAELFVNGFQVKKDSLIQLIRGQENIVELKAPILNGGEVSLNAVGDEDLVVPDPKYGEWTTFIDNIATWTVTQEQSESGKLHWVFVAKDILAPLELWCYVIEKNLNLEVKVLFNGDPLPDEGADLKGGETVNVSVQYLNGEVLKGVPLAINVTANPPLGTDDFTVDPKPGEFATQHEWKLLIPVKKGSFKLELYTEDKNSSLLTPTNRINQELEEVIYYYFRLDDSNPDPEPVEEFLLPDDVVLTQCKVMLRTIGGVPFAGVRVTSYMPATPDGTSFNTDKEGVARVFITNDTHEVGHTFNVRSVAGLSDGYREIELPVTVVKA